ncbi:hypothetical protein V8B55DRAFT_1351757 [Mucor lusitanicus]|uniref:Extracellular membrane protein CFEM domain-containing protein n=1 Tax=Mucor lusitanicus CBS 277.49 TaxID=747725 RepID=A0A162TXI0_MUCCL|nr:hypothetical protein MUCCIDRAFT_104882 [Mucor lusitanicus CBS 277.49]
MRLQWCIIILLSAVSLAHTLEIKEGSKKNIDDKAKEKLSEHCSDFIESCVQLCQDETIEAFSTSCSAREATCHCNEKDVSAMIYENLLSKVEQQPAQAGKKKKLQVETDDSVLSPVQFNAVVASPDEDVEQEALLEDYYQQMEFIYPRHEIMKNPAFQQGFCSKFLMRCKQDCPAAFSSYFCSVNEPETGFLLSCVCNGVDLAASVNAQVQAESG